MSEATELAKREMAQDSMRTKYAGWADSHPEQAKVNLLAEAVLASDAELQRYRGALEGVEWILIQSESDRGPIYECPACRHCVPERNRGRREFHAGDCPIANALTHNENKEPG